MLEFSAGAPELYRPSPFWTDLSGAHVQEIQESGFEDLKRTVNTRYFNWRALGIVRHQMLGLGADWARHPSSEPLRAKFPDRAPFGPASAWIYKTFVAMYADLLRRSDPLDLVSRLHEPELGHPFIVKYRGQDLSQDLCNSIHELYSILGERPDPDQPRSVCEIGAGYGRLGFAFLEALPRTSYCIVDIPPALYLSQRYLTTLFPDDSAFRFRPFDRFEDVREEFEGARIRFLAASQIELLPERTFDYFVNISSLHEMTTAQIENYFRQMDRLCRGRVYTKQWRASRAKVNGAVIREHDYPVPPGWREIYHRRHPIQRMFFDALYEVGSPELLERASGNGVQEVAPSP
jgi:putative sugar O-methyltransferase